VFVLVDNWGQLHQELDELTDELGGLAATGLHHGVHLVATYAGMGIVRDSVRAHARDGYLGLAGVLHPTRASAAAGYRPFSRYAEESGPVAC
jgi:hypothetical protein